MIALLQVALTALQIALGFRVIARMVRTARGRPLARATSSAARCTVLLPVLNEERRLGPCLDGVMAQGASVERIFVIDGGSTDGTRALVRTAAERDLRIALLTTEPAPVGFNGKAWQLQRGFEAAREAAWLLTLDADVRPDPDLAASMLVRAREDGAGLLSAGTRQRVADPLDGLLHPAMLTTLVYRFGIPGNVATNLLEVQANGQCFLIQRDLLARLGGFNAVLHELAEDVALARLAARAGARVGFVEAGPLALVEMYASWRETWRGWLRSLPLRDRVVGPWAWLGLVEVALVQATPLLLLPLWQLSGFGLGAAVNGILLIARLGTLAGTRRAYADPPPIYWLSPLADVPVAVGLWLSALRRRHRWRGRTIRRGDASCPNACPD